MGRLIIQGETEISWHHLKEVQVSGDSTDILNQALLKCIEQKHVHTHRTQSEVTLGCTSHNISVENKDMSISEKLLENLPAPNGTKDPKRISYTQQALLRFSSPIIYSHVDDLLSSMEYKRRCLVDSAYFFYTMHWNVD